MPLMYKRNHHIDMQQELHMVFCVCNLSLFDIFYFVSSLYLQIDYPKEKIVSVFSLDKPNVFEPPN